MAESKIKYGTIITPTITLASLATSATLLTGRESAAVDNSTNLYIDVLASGQVTTGTSPTDAKKIEIWAWGSFDDTPNYPDVFDGTDSAETVTSDDIKFAALRLVASMSTDNTSDRAYPFAPVSIAGLFGQLPQYYGFFVTHDTGVNLNSTAGNHFIDLTPITYTTA
jgi:hypothetical protein